ncbi:MAG TPA: FG-GAP-like repeat-containing protein [Pyrinomonadaceae bacterium]|nr:FG-GAP-like repeat-containing protein [Pyrinomonadaceae bacterium]
MGNNHIVADFNGDGLLDLAGLGAQSAAIMLGNGDGTFRPRAEYPVASWAQDLAAGDFNGDGRLDLVVTINDPQIGLSLLTGNGDGTFNAPLNSPNTSGFDSPAVVATDLNNDGKLDIVAAHQIACFTAPCNPALSISVLLGNGDATFQPAREIEVGSGMTRIAVADLNRDGFKDLGISGDRSQVFVLLGNGDGTFTQKPTITLTSDTLGVDATDIDVADFNGDTVEDLVVAIGLNGSRTAVLIGNGDGTFRDPLIITEPNLRIPHYQAIADYNGDGFLDLAIGLGWGQQGLMEILKGVGGGSFQQPELYLVPPPDSSQGGGTLISADFNRDGKPDIALQVRGANGVLSVLINRTGVSSTPPAFGTMTASPSSVVGGSSSQITVNLANGSVAPAGGLTLSVSSSNTSVVTVPSSVTIPAGSSSVRFTATTRSVTSTQSVTVRASNNQLGSRQVTLTVTPAPASAVNVSSLSLSPSTVTGGSSVQGVVTLSTTARVATTVALSSSSDRATLPSSVTVAAGSSSARFTINTSAVTSTTTVNISATLNGATRTTTLTINPASATTDTVSITRAEYESSKRSLRVEATSTRSNATLQVFNTATGQLIGTLSNQGGGRYGGQFSVSSNPQNITVRSSFGGVATRSVSAR